MAIIYVDPTLGNDTTGTGSYVAPYKTLAKGCTIAVTLDTVRIKTGIHTLTANLTENISGSKQLTIDSESGDGKTTRFDGNANTYWAFISSSMDLPLTIKNIGFSNMASKGVFLTFAVTTYVFENLYFKNLIGQGGLNGLIQVSSGSVINVTIRNCIIDDINTITVNTRFFRFDNSSKSDIYFYNNTFSYRSGALTACISNFNQTGVDHRVYIDNNIIRNTSTGTIKATVLLVQDTSNVINIYQRNNCVFASGAGTSITNYTGTPASYTASGGITADPLFIDATNSDFRVQASSPCINTGMII